MNLDGVYQLKSIYYDGIEFKTARFGRHPIWKMRTRTYDATRRRTY